jgi:hypothetical protein
MSEQLFVSVLRFTFVDVDNTVGYEYGMLWLVEC